MTRIFMSSWASPHGFPEQSFDPPAEVRGFPQAALEDPLFQQIPDRLIVFGIEIGYGKIGEIPEGAGIEPIQKSFDAVTAFLNEEMGERIVQEGCQGNRPEGEVKQPRIAFDDDEGTVMMHSSYGRGVIPEAESEHRQCPGVSRSETGPSKGFFLRIVRTVDVSDKAFSRNRPRRYLPVECWNKLPRRSPLIPSHPVCEDGRPPVKNPHVFIKDMIRFIHRLPQRCASGAGTEKTPLRLLNRLCLSFQSNRGVTQDIPGENKETPHDGEPVGHLSDPRHG